MTRKRPKRWRRWAKRAGVVVLTILMVAIAVSIRWTVSLTRYQQDDLAPVWQSISLSSGAFEANWIGDARSGNIGDLRLSIIAQPAEFRVYPLSYQGGLGSHGLLLPLWVPLVFIAIPVGWLVWTDRRHRPGVCHKCGYNLTGLAGGPCPECGAAADPSG